MLRASFRATGTLAAARAYGLDRPFTLRGADIALAGGDRHRLRLVQWLEPYDDGLPYPGQLVTLG